VSTLGKECAEGEGVVLIADGEHVKYRWGKKRIEERPAWISFWLLADSRQQTKTADSR
jgi:hypothetical protein